MKKIFLFLSFALLIICAQAQDKTTTVGSNGYVKTTAFTSSDNIGASDTYWVLFNYLEWKLPYALRTSVKITKLSGTPHGDLTIYGRNFETTTWTVIDSVHFPTLRGTDTTINYTGAPANYAAGLKYTQLKIKVHTTADVQSSRLGNYYFKALDAPSY